MPTSKKTLRELLRSSFSFYAVHGFSLLKILIVFLIPIFFINESFWENRPLIDRLVDQFSVRGFHVIDDTINVILILWAFLYFIAQIQCILKIDVKETIGAVSAYKKAFSIFGSYLKVKIFYVVKTALWSLLLIIPGIIFGVLYSFHSMAFLIDGKNGNEALQFSKQIIKPNVLVYLGYMMVLVMTMYAFSMPVLLILEFISETYVMMEWMAKIIGYLQIFIIGLAVNYGIVLYYMIYEELRTRPTQNT